MGSCIKISFSNESYKKGRIPSMLLNVYEFGMKKYSSQPIAALLERKDEL